MQALKSKTREGRGGNNLQNPDIESASDHSIRAGWPIVHCPGCACDCERLGGRREERKSDYSRTVEVISNEALRQQYVMA